MPDMDSRAVRKFLNYKRFESLRNLADQGELVPLVKNDNGVGWRRVEPFESTPRQGWMYDSDEVNAWLANNQELTEGFDASYVDPELKEKILLAATHFVASEGKMHRTHLLAQLIESGIGNTSSNFYMEYKAILDAAGYPHRTIRAKKRKSFKR